MKGRLAMGLCLLLPCLFACTEDNITGPGKLSPEQQNQAEVVITNAPGGASGGTGGRPPGGGG